MFKSDFKVPVLPANRGINLDVSPTMTRPKARSIVRRFSPDSPVCISQPRVRRSVGPSEINNDATIRRRGTIKPSETKNYRGTPTAMRKSSSVRPSEVKTETRASTFLHRETGARPVSTVLRRGNSVSHSEVKTETTPLVVTRSRSVRPGSVRPAEIKIEAGRVTPRRRCSSVGSTESSSLSVAPKIKGRSSSVAPLAKGRSPSASPRARTAYRILPVDDYSKWFSDGIGGVSIFPSLTIGSHEGLPEKGTNFIESVLDRRYSQEQKENLYRVKWAGYSLNCFDDVDTNDFKEWYLSKDEFVCDAGEEPQAIAFFTKREFIAKKFATHLKKVLGADEFEKLYSQYEHRNEYKKVGEPATLEQTNRLYIRGVETEWNEKLAAAGHGRVFIFDWTNGPIRQFKLKYSTSVSCDNETMTELEQRLGKFCYESSSQGMAFCSHTGPCNASCPCSTSDDTTVVMRSGRFDTSTVKPGSHAICCNERCRCDKSCPRRIVEHGRKKDVILFYINAVKGWGVFAAEHIPISTFMGNYSGVINFSSQMGARNRDLTYEFVLPNDNLLGAFTLNAKRQGNETRFYNHACDANLRAINFYASVDGLINDVGFLTKEAVPFGDELTFSYTSESVKGKNKIRCRCTVDCRNYL